MRHQGGREVAEEAGEAHQSPSKVGSKVQGVVPGANKPEASRPESELQSQSFTKSLLSSTCQREGPGGEEDSEAGAGLEEGDGQSQQSEAEETDRAADFAS